MDGAVQKYVELDAPIVSATLSDDETKHMVKEICAVIEGDNSLMHSNSLFGRYAGLVSKSSAESRAAWTGEMLSRLFDVSRLKGSVTCYVSSNFARNKFLCRRFDDEDLNAWIGEWHRIFWGYRSGSEVRKACDSVVSNIDSRGLIQCLDRRFIMVGDDLVWDRSIPELLHIDELSDTDKYPEKPRIFSKCFDTPHPDKNTVQIPKFEDWQTELLLKTYDENKELPINKRKEDIKAVKDWADGVPGVYWDMMYELSSMFLKTYPRYCFLNIGVGCNGKSALEGLAGTIIGGANMGRIPADQTASWDHLYTLQTIWLNCPNETPKDYFEKNTDEFKTVAAHETFTCKKKNASNGVDVTTDFIYVLNVNQTPTFDKDSEACIDRIYPVVFRADFSKRMVNDFAKKTYCEDKEFIPKLLGQLLALAHYYSQPGNEWKMSQDGKDELGNLREFASPNVNYFKLFSKFFRAYEGISLVKEDYVNWGRASGQYYSRKDIAQNDLQFKSFKRQVRADGKTNYVGNKNLSLMILEEKFRSNTLTGGMSLKDFHEHGGSVIAELEIQYGLAKIELEKEAKESANSLLGGKEVDLSEESIIRRTMFNVAEKDRKTTL